ncbi:hypothetical protein PHMEG_00026112 [Phytophthora megakarya]|uniref:Uncharacterized protein n=1 Tax=Phytophthora megakarya TaxID=4795 RepID=A0A225VCX6_9STRA|nr:hypothetical protein PHMEG_00026112 [Phytophthora megakarya]
MYNTRTHVHPGWLFILSVQILEVPRSWVAFRFWLRYTSSTRKVFTDIVSHTSVEATPPSPNKPKIMHICGSNFKGSEVYPGLGAGFETFIHLFEHVIRTEELVNEFTWGNDINMLVIASILEGKLPEYLSFIESPIESPIKGDQTKMVTEVFGNNSCPKLAPTLLSSVPDDATDYLVETDRMKRLLYKLKDDGCRCDVKRDHRKNLNDDSRTPKTLNKSSDRQNDINQWCNH